MNKYHLRTFSIRVYQKTQETKEVQELEKLLE